MKIEIANKHAVFQEGDGYVIFDTGSPTTYERGGLILDFDMLSRKVGRKIVKLLGTDSMPGPVYIDYRNGRLEFQYAGEEAFADALPCQMVMELPTIEIQIAGAACKMFLDSGAPTSYISPTITAGLEPSGTISDFHPVVGEYTSDVFSLETEILDFKGSLSYAHFPRAMACALELCECDGIIGYDLFSRFAALWDPEQGQLWLKRNDI